MAAPPSGLFSRHGSCKRRIDHCLVDVHDSVSYVPGLLRLVSLHISYDNDGVSFFRLRVPVKLWDNSETTDIFLDISTNRLISLFLCQQPQLPERLASSVQPSQARLRLVLPQSAGVLIAPLAIKTLTPATPFDEQVLRTMRILSESPTISIYLPPGDDLGEHLPQMPSSSNMTTPEPLIQLGGSHTHLDLNTFYRGKGGRVIPPREAFGHPVVGNTAEGECADPNTSTPPVVPPPSYNENIPPGTPDPLPSARKRPRASPGQSQGGEGSDKPGRLDALQGIWAQATSVIEDLHASTAAAAAMDARLRATMREAERAQHSDVGRHPYRSSPPRAASASLSPHAASSIETASRASCVSEAISERLKDYLDERLEQFKQDMRRRVHESLGEYSTVEDMEIYVERKVAESTVDLVEGPEMDQAIQEAVDKVFDTIRSRVLDAWDY